MLSIENTEGFECQRRKCQPPPPPPLTIHNDQYDGVAYVFFVLLDHEWIKQLPGAGRAAIFVPQEYVILYMYISCVGNAYLEVVMSSIQAEELESEPTLLGFIKDFTPYIYSELEIKFHHSSCFAC